MTVKGRRPTTFTFLLLAGVFVLGVGVIAFLSWGTESNGPPEVLAAAPAPGNPGNQESEGVSALVEASQERAALDMDPAEPQADAKTEAPAAVPSIIGLGGFVTMSPESSWVDVREIRQIGARVRVGGEVKLLPIPVSSGRFELRFVQQEDGTYALPNGSRSFPSLDGQGSVELFAPRLGDAIGQLSFEDTGHGVLEGGAKITYPFGADGVGLILKAAARVQLFTFDAATDEPLDDVDLFRAGTQVKRGRTLSTSQGAIAHGLAHGAPIPAADGPRARMELEAYVAGYAKQRFMADFAAGEPVRLRLERGATLHVKVVGELPDNAFVEVRSTIPLGSAIPSKRGDVTFRELPSEALAVSLLVGDDSRVFRSDSARRTELLDVASIHLAPGEEARIELHALGSTPLPSTSVGGWIRVPKAWSPPGNGIPYQLIPTQGQSLPKAERVTDAPLLSGPGNSASDQAADSLVTYPFHAGEIPLGEYVVYLPSIPASSTLSVLPSESNQLSVSMPQPIEQRVRVVDQETRAVLPFEELSVRIDRFRHWIPIRIVKKAPGADEFIFLVQDDPITLIATEGDRYFGLRKTIPKPRPGLQIIEATRIEAVQTRDGLLLPVTGTVR